MAARFLFLCFRIRLERDQKETRKRPKRDQKERKSEGEKSNRAIWRIFKLFCGSSASFPCFVALCAREWPGRTRAGRQSFPTVRNAGGCAKIWLNIMVKIYKMSGWWILYMTGVILGAGLICAFSRQLPRPKCTNSPRVKYSKSGLKPNRTFNTKLIKELFGFVAEAA